MLHDAVRLLLTWMLPGYSTSVLSSRGWCPHFSNDATAVVRAVGYVLQSGAMFRRVKCFPDLCFYTYCCFTARTVMLERWVPATSCYRAKPEEFRPQKQIPHNIMRMLEELRKEDSGAVCSDSPISSPSFT